VSYFGREAAWKKVAGRETSGTKMANPLRIEGAPDIAQTSGRAFSAAGLVDLPPRRFTSGYLLPPRSAAKNKLRRYPPKARLDKRGFGSLDYPVSGQALMLGCALGLINNQISFLEITRNPWQFRQPRLGAAW